jgi:manganese-dependent ADP-ribose/CDP-alcohol diphosphatase
MNIPVTSLFAIIISLIMTGNKIHQPVSEIQQSQQPLFSFGIITDVQYCDCDPSGTIYYRSSLSKLDEAMKTLKKASPDFVINLGDLIDRGYDSYKPVLRIIDSSDMKIYHITGNHDYSVDPRFLNKLPVLISSKAGYYSFSDNGFRFILLNGNEISIYASKKKASVVSATSYIELLKNGGAKNAVYWNGGISKTQLEWLDKQLSQSLEKNEKVFVFCHFPVWPESEYNLLNYNEMLFVLEKYDHIVAYFAGHNHNGNYGNRNMIHFVTMKGMAETESMPSYSLVDVYNNKIWINGYGREKSQILAY